MALRRFVRGRIEWERLEEVFEQIKDRYDYPEVRVVFLEADNWLSTPCIVNDDLFVKIITRQNLLVHALFTGARNLGAFSSGTEGFFEHFGTPVEMAEHELAATQRMREIGLNVPDPIEAFAVGDLGIVVLEYLPEFRILDDLDTQDVNGFAGPLFASLREMHEHNLAHGDLRGENVLVYKEKLYFIDATNVRAEGLAGARAYDLACALGALTPLIGARAAVRAAAEHHSAEQLLDAREFLDFVNIRPDHDFDAAHVKGEIEKRADGEANA